MSANGKAAPGRYSGRRPRLALILVGISVLALLGSVAGRVYFSGEKELELGRRALADGKVIAAQKHFLFAARWYLPLVTTSGDAVRELLALGEFHLDKGDFPRGVAAFDDARGARDCMAGRPRPEVAGRRGRRPGQEPGEVEETT